MDVCFDIDSLPTPERRSIMKNHTTLYDLIAAVDKNGGLGEDGILTTV